MVTLTKRIILQDLSESPLNFNLIMDTENTDTAVTPASLDELRVSAKSMSLDEQVHRVKNKDLANSSKSEIELDVSS